MPHVEFQNLTKLFPGAVRAVDDLTLDVAAGELLVLVGPSGCGKSTALRMLAGLETPTSGDIRIDGRIVNDVPPQKRDIAMVFQYYALYPHKTVRGNLEFPLRMAGMKRAERNRRVAETAALLELAPLLERKPGQLSGGQRQRVAMGRALVRQPRVFLMDEPLSNLDAELRVQIRREIAKLQAELRITTLYVTHDQTEALTLGHRVAVLRGGRLQQVAAGQELYDRPANTFVAGFIGSPRMNLVPGRLQRRETGELGVDLGGGVVTIPREFVGEQLEKRLDQDVVVGIRPEALTFVDGDDVGAAAIHAAITAVESLGHERLLYFLPVTTGTRPPTLDTPLVARVSQSVGVVNVGDRVRLRVDAAQLHWFHADGSRLPTR